MVVEALSYSSFEFRTAVAKNPAIPARLLSILAEDEDEYARVEGAYNPATRGNLLELLAGDSDEYVRAAIAGC